MSIKATITLTKLVKTRLEAEELFARIRESLQGNLEVTMQSAIHEHQEKVEITK